jgi:hypothetical protein
MNDDDEELLRLFHRDIVALIRCEAMAVARRSKMLADGLRTPRTLPESLTCLLHPFGFCGR